MNEAARQPVLGVDIGGTKVCLGLVSRDGALLRASRYPLRETAADGMADNLLRRVEMFLAECGGARVGGAGIGIKAMVGPDRRAILRSSILGGLTVDLCGALERRFGLTAALDNDVHAATLAEMRFGAGREHRDFVYVNMGTGTAAGIVADGQLVRGHRNCAGEFGLWLCPRADDGQLVELESVASGGGLAREATRLRERFAGGPSASGELDARWVLDGCGQGDALALAAMESFLQVASPALLNLAVLLDPALIVLGGGLCGDDRLLSRLCERVGEDAECYGMLWGARMERSRLGADEAGVIGAAAVWMAEAAREDRKEWRT